MFLAFPKFNPYRKVFFKQKNHFLSDKYTPNQSIMQAYYFKRKIRFAFL